MSQNVLIWYDGIFLEPEDLHLSFEDFQKQVYGAVYETIRTYDGKPFALKKHFDRMKRSLSYLREEISIDFGNFLKIVLDGIEKLGSESRIQVFQIPRSGKIFFIFSQLKGIDVSRGVRIGISSVRKADPLSIPPQLKMTARADILLARIFIKDSYDNIMLGPKGQVCEGTFSNVFIVKKGKIVTPSVDSGILDGVTRENVIALARELGIPIEERWMELKELINADEVFLTHTSVGIVPVKGIEEKVLFETGTGTLTDRLRRNFEDFIRERKENWEGIS